MDNSDIKLKHPRPYSEHELLTEIFGFVPTTVLDDMFNLANVLFYKFMEGTADKLITAKPEKQREINMALEKYERLTETQLDQLFNVLQQYISQGTWHIPEDLNIQLDQHKDLDFSITDQDNEEIDAQLTKLREQIIAQKKFKAVLNQTHKDLQEKNMKLDTRLEKLNFLKDIAKQEKVDNVTESLKFVKDQSDLLKTSVIDNVNLNPEATEENKDVTKRTKYLRELIRAELDKL